MRVSVRGHDTREEFDPAHLGSLCLPSVCFGPQRLKPLFDVAVIAALKRCATQRLMEWATGLFWTAAAQAALLRLAVIAALKRCATQRLMEWATGLFWTAAAEAGL
jgi:hypothetical protein